MVLPVQELLGYLTGSRGTTSCQTVKGTEKQQLGLPKGPPCLGTGRQSAKPRLRFHNVFRKKNLKLRAAKELMQLQSKRWHSQGWTYARSLKHFSSPPHLMAEYKWCSGWWGSWQTEVHSQSTDVKTAEQFTNDAAPWNPSTRMK